MTLIHGRTDDRVRPGARARLTRIRLRTRVVVIARRSIGLVRIAARAGGRIACPRDMALIERRTNHGTRAHASARLARIRLRATIAVIT